ncbi:multiple monosaccharide ABC transporter permease [Clostridium sp. 'White wine YQ']|uniref:multiple monosaccharide ABC transporter permease n=1 Tax=Clostridium sp. 'White wine YQ' TaxID=3027474 RepID=UPI002364FD7D|nr:multiple monosaccharide ABC transporter permease [Clostridium sp. 'White wine YQ']MDD7795690.1 sugar ABC transporter permease [Clostridium sp. 'White wine YQ']
MSDIQTENKTKVTNEGSILSVLKKSMKTNLRQYTMFIALIAISLIFTFLTDGTFLTSRNLSNLLLQTATTAILACGMVLIIIAGHIDLSVGSVAGFTGAIAALLQVKYGWETAPTIVVTILVGIAVGVWQGFWVSYQGVPAFIVTLGGMMIFRGGVMAVTKGQTIAPTKPAFKAIGQGYLPKISDNLNDTTIALGILIIVAYLFLEIRKRKIRVTKYNFKVLPLPLEIAKLTAVSAMIALLFLIMISYRGIPYSIVLVLGLVLLFSFITTKTTLGRYVYAIGGNKEASKLSGINIQKVTMLIFVIMGFLSAVAGIVFTGRLDSATASAGNLFELDAIAACYIGGASAMGGEGSVMGAMIGALVMATLNNGMSLMNVDLTYQYIIKGLILLIAVRVDIATRKKAA